MQTERTYGLDEQTERTYGLDEAFYLQMIVNFVEKGEVAIPADPISNYLAGIMSDHGLQAVVLLDEVRARIFQDNMMRFVDAALRRHRFNFNRRQSEMKGVGETLEWSLDKRKDGWNALIDKLEQGYSRYGFRSAFFRQQFQQEKNLGNDALWESLYKEYKLALDECLHQEVQQHVDQGADANRKRLEQLLQIVPEYLEKHAIEKEEFMQAWGMMGGEWNEYDFNRYIRLVRMQQEYPELVMLANRMGRIVSPDGERSLWVGTGKSLPIDHSAKSDIQGVTFGNRLDALLPTEMVQLADDDFEDVFLSKYTTRQLQSFLHKSNQLSPNRRLEHRRARRKGPMVVCVDTSGSMAGKPEQIARSLLIRLVDMAHRQQRELFIIAFSVSAKPIDAMRDRVRLLDYFAHQSTGDTHAQRMVELMLALLQESTRYASADVLIVGDFRMPLVPAPLLRQIADLRLQDTCFYGLQIGGNPDNKWRQHLDQVTSIGFLH